MRCREFCAVQELRERKLRVDKPFAVMVPDVHEAGLQCVLSSAELQMLESSARPIVLVRRRAGSSIVRHVAPGLDQLGLMLPYTPLHHLLMQRAPGFPSALVMTSGNLSEEPIATDNDEAQAAPLRTRGCLPDERSGHPHPVRRLCGLVAAIGGAPSQSSAGVSEPSTLYPARRSRGYVPFPVRFPWKVDPLLAVGAELKNTFCITNRNYGFMKSPHRRSSKLRNPSFL